MIPLLSGVIAAKQKEERLPQKLTAFMFQPADRQGQDGAVALSVSSMLLQPSLPSAASSQENKSVQMAHVIADICDSPPGTQTTSTLAKARMRMDSSAPVTHEVSQPPLPPGPHSAQPGVIALFLTTNQPAMDTTLKDMLISLRSTLQSDMSFMQQFKQDVTSLGDRMSHVETQMGACASTVNTLIDTQADHNEHHDWIKDKLAELEDRSHRKNIKIRGISEEIQTQDLSPYVCNLLKALIP